MPLSPLPPTVQPGGNQKRPSWSRSLSSLHSNYTRNSETSKQSGLISARQSVLPFLLQGREDSGKREIFTDAAAMKDRIRAQACKREYDVRHFYHESGFAQRLARHDLFGNLALLVITLNVLWIALDAEYNTEPTLATAHPIFVVMENFFCIYFSVEWLIRLLAFKYKRNCLRDSWFILDTILVLFMVTETWVITLVVLLLGGDASSISNVAVIRIARVSRITRMARMGRLLKLMPELLILLKGISAAARPVAFTLMLLCCVTYLFGITFRQITDGTAVGSQFFPSVVASMHTLLLYGTLLDNISEVVRELEAENVALVVVFYLFVLLASLTITNLLIGVLCEVVTAVAATEKEQLTVQFMKTQLTSILASIGVDPSAEAPVISKEHLTRMLDKPEVCRTLTEVGVDVLVLVDNIEFIFAPDPMDEEEDAPPEKMLTFGQLLELILELRGSNTATVRDIVELRKYVRFVGDDLLLEMQDDGRNMVSLFARHSSMALEGDYGDRGRDDLSPASLGESTQGWPSLFRSTNKAPNLAEMRSSLVRALSDVQRETHRFVDSLPADAKGMVSTLPMAEVRSWEEAENDNLKDAAASIRGGDKRLCWTSEEVETMRGMLCGLVVQTASGLAELQRLRVSGSHWPSADQFGACLGCS